MLIGEQKFRVQLKVLLFSAPAERVIALAILSIKGYLIMAPILIVIAVRYMLGFEAVLNKDKKVLPCRGFREETVVTVDSAATVGMCSRWASKARASI
jgi:hypothetical protein